MHLKIISCSWHCFSTLFIVNDDILLRGIQTPRINSPWPSVENVRREIDLIYLYNDALMCRKPFHLSFSHKGDKNVAPDKG